MYNVSDSYKTAIKEPIRYTGISGTIHLKTGETVRITDSNIVGGSLSIVRKMNGRGDFRPGGVYSSELSVGLKGFSAKTSDLDGAIIGLNFLLYTDAKKTEYETVPLGRFYADGSAIKRKFDTVTLKADDGMMLFDVPATERSGTLFELVSTACSACNVPLAISQEEFEELPNGTMSASVNTARIQTERDLLMYVGILTASFARVSRISGGLEFVPLECERTDGGMIIPVREIAGDIRFSTDFSDDAVRITKLFTRQNGERVESTLHIIAGGSEKLAQLELSENPLLAGVEKSDIQSALNNALKKMLWCINRAFSTDFNGDPALDVGDYVRLRGGAIDSDRGYATGMITSMVWRYRGKHTIKCVMPSSLSEVTDTSAASVVALSDDDDTDASSGNERVQPKSQLEKRVDALEKALAGLGVDTAKYLKTADGAATAQTYAQGLVVLNEQGQVLLQTANTTGSGGLLQLDFTGAKINTNTPYNIAIENGRIFLQSTSVQIELNPSFIRLQNGNNLDFQMYQTGFYINTPNASLRVDADGLYVNGSKIG